MLESRWKRFTILNPDADLDDREVLVLGDIFTSLSHLVDGEEVEGRIEK